MSSSERRMSEESNSSKEDGVPMVSTDNFLSSEFEERFRLLAQQYGSAGLELIRGKALTDADFDIPDGNELVRVYVDENSKEYIQSVRKGDIEEMQTVEKMWNAGLTPGDKKKHENELLSPAKNKGTKKKVQDYRKIRIEVRKYKDVEKEVFSAKLQNGLRRKEQHVYLKQKLCSKLMMKLEKSLRVSVQQHKDYERCMHESDIIELFAIVKECATGRGAQSVAILLFQLLQLVQKSDSVEDFELYLKEYKNLVIDIMKLGNLCMD